MSLSMIWAPGLRLSMKAKTKTINLMLLDGGVGDHVASLSAVHYIITQYNWLTPLVWLPDFLQELAKNVLPKGTAIYGFSQMRGLYDPTKPTKTTKWDGSTSPMKIHCVDYSFLKLCDENPEARYKNYLKVSMEDILIPDMPSDYVVLTTGFTADVREWPAASVNGTAQWCIKQGLTPVFLGQTNTRTGVQHVIKGSFSAEIEYDKGVNLVDKTSLLQAIRIMYGAKAILGVDNGLLHAAGCTDVPIIGGFTTVSPDIRMAYRNDILGWKYYPVTPDVDLSCKFCQQKTNFLYGHDYKNCLFKNDAFKRNKCVSQMTADKFISQLEKALILRQIS